ncbi:MAG TPA: 5-guanidino-2-oxopentanoate decarboxylase [Candidatus Cybelea sp.]|nr:5-guanidino-2-oxopentanoate decarboxylase [Candidatus Cybelea sp.]
MAVNEAPARQGPVNQIGGHAVISLLEAYGVDTVFGIPGVHTLELYRGIADRRMRHIGVRHEQGAGFIADGYARASGTPGVCCLITGPGLMNAATPIGQAYSDSVPVLVLCSVNATPDLGKGRGRLHEISDQRAAIAPLTAFTRTVMDAKEMVSAVADAFAVFETKRPRPVVLEFPLDVLAAPADIGQPQRARAARPKAKVEDLDAAAKLIDGAQRPLLLVGGGTVDCAPGVRAFLERSGALGVTTTAGKGVISPAHAASLGSSLATKPTQAYLAEADVVIAIGTELAETDSWVDRLEIKGKIVRVDLDAFTLTRDYPPAVAILADAGETLAALSQRIKPGRKPDTARAAEIRKAIRDGLSPLERKHVKVLDALRAGLPRDGIVVSDMTQIAYTANVHFPCDEPRTWFHPCGFGTLGYAMPAAIGAKIARPDRAVVALAGDAGFLFTVQELGTAAELGLPLPILLWNNDALGQIALNMRDVGIEEIAVKPRNPDFATLAKAYGIRHVRPESLGGISAALAETFRANGPTLIEVREDSAYLS